MSVLFLTAKAAKIANKKGVSPVDPKRFGEESKESFPSPPGWELRAVKEEEAFSKKECPL